MSVKVLGFSYETNGHINKTGVDMVTDMVFEEKLLAVLNLNHEQNNNRLPPTPIYD